MRLKDYTVSANTGLDAIKRAPIVDYDTGLKCIRIQDISQKKKYEEWGNTETSESDYKKFLLKKNDLLVARTGATVGVSYLVNEDLEAVYNNGTIRLRLNDKISTRFVYYVFKTKSFLQFIDNVSCVATQPNLRVETLLRYNLPDFSLEQQERIADILSAYDKLITINQSKIQVLEELASSMYIEWFIHNRYPHSLDCNMSENNPKRWKIKNKNIHFIPDTWHYGELCEIASFVRGKNITAANMIEGSVPVISAGLEPSGYHNNANVLGYNITVSASGANAGFLKYNLCDIWAADCSYYDGKNNLWFVYNTLHFLQPVISNLQCGAAQPHVYPKHLNKLEILIPSENLIKLFNDTVEPIYEEIALLLKENDYLNEQMDLMIPRLMNGKIAV